MIIKRLTILFFLICFSAHAIANITETTSDNLSEVSDKNQFITTKVIKLYDKTRSRLIPINLYINTQRKANAGILKMPVVIINHGYTVKNTEYSFLANALAAQGYFVVSIQHDLKTDTTFPTTGNLYEQRKPLWDRGVANILFVIKSLPNIAPNLNLTKVTLIGHSNGGDMVMLFTKEHPDLVKQAISLDSLRMPFPRSGKIPILSLRANDTQADPGVLPPEKTDKKFNITIISLKDAKHIDLCDRGSKSIRKEINKFVLSFLRTTI